MKASGYMGSLLAVLLLLVASGCGGDGDESASAAEPLSKSEFVRRADAACEKAEELKTRQVEELLGTQARTGRVPDRKIEAAIVEGVLPVYKALIADLSRLAPPVKDKPQVTAFIGSYKAALKDAEADPSRLMTTNPFAKAYVAARRYGIECAS